MLGLFAREGHLLQLKYLALHPCNVLILAACSAGLVSPCFAEEKPDTTAEFLAPDVIKGDKSVPVTSAKDDVKPIETGDETAPKPKPIGPSESKPDADVTLQETKGVYVTEEEAIEYAVLNNLGLKISRLNDRGADINVRVAWSTYFPEFNANIRHSNSRRPGERAGDGTTTFNGGFTQRSPWGTTLDFALSESRSRLSTDTASGNIGATVRQPLWKGFGTDVGLVDIRTARINRLISRGNLELDTQQIIFQVRRAYANIIRAIQNRAVNRQAVRSAEKFLELSAAREGAGQVTKLDVFNAEVQLRGRELDLITTERELENAYDQLKILMDVDLSEIIRVDAPTVDFGERVEPPLMKRLQHDEKSGTVMLVTYQDDKVVGKPVVLFQATHYDEVTILKEALENRIDLLNSRRSLAIQKLQTLLAKDGLGHQIDLVGSFDRSNAGRSVVESDNGQEINNWSVGVNASIPWGKIRDRAAYERAMLDLQRAEIELKRTRTDVQADVRDIMRALRQLEKGLLIEGQRVEQAKRSVEAAQISFDRGLKDSFDVIRAEDDLLRAKTQFINRKLDYVVQLAQLETTVGKPTGRVDLEGQSVGGLIDARLPEEFRTRGLPAAQPDPEERPEDDPFNRSRQYRKDYKPLKDCPLPTEGVQVDVPPASLPAEVKPVKK
jgi:outer membrane protein TolC